MAESQFSLADAIQAPLFGLNVINESTKTNRFVQSGILTPDADFGSHLLESSEDIMTLPFTNDLEGDPEMWSDTKDITVAGMTTGSQRAFRLKLDKAFGYTDISQQFSVSNPADVISTRFSNWWNVVDQKTLMAILSGVFANEDIAAAKLFDDSAKNFGPRGFLATINKLGDLQDQTFNKIAVNSAAYAEMKAQQMIDTVQPGQAVTPFGNYNGMQIVVDDDLPLDDSGVATSYIFGSGSVAYSVANPTNGVEVEREAKKQGGRTNVINRRVESIHVKGTSVAKGFTPAEQSVTIADLSDGATWEMAKDVDPRNIHVVAYKAKVSDDFLPKKRAASASTTSSTSGSTATK